MRDAPSFLRELDYWQAALDDLGALNDGIKATADVLLDVRAPLLTACVQHPTRELVEVAEVIAGGMKTLHGLAALLDRLIALAEGRSIALRAEWDESREPS